MANKILEEKVGHQLSLFPEEDLQNYSDSGIRSTANDCSQGRVREETKIISIEKYREKLEEEESIRRGDEILVNESKYTNLNYIPGVTKIEFDH